MLVAEAPALLEGTDVFLDRIESAMDELEKTMPADAVWTTPPRQKVALVVGGTRGIGRAVGDALSQKGWWVDATGQLELDLADPKTWDPFFRFDSSPQFDFVLFAAGDLRPLPWARKSTLDFLRSYLVHAVGPVRLLSQFRDRFPWWCKVCFVSSVGATNDGIVDLAYGMAKAALDKAARALAEHEAWDVHLVRFDLVDTDTMHRLPTETLHGRRALSVDEAAQRILTECGLS